jgi:hypothetical protein
LGGGAGGLGGGGLGGSTSILQFGPVVEVQPSSGGTTGGGGGGHLITTGGGFGLQPQDLEQITVSDTVTRHPPGPEPVAPVYVYVL